jgi:hypothetical protein
MVSTVPYTLGKRLLTTAFSYTGAGIEYGPSMKCLRLISAMTISLFVACVSDSGTGAVSEPIFPGDPVLVHTGENLVLRPYYAAEESLYVKNAKPGEWAVALLSAPAGTRLEGSKISYLIPEGLSGNVEMHGIASDKTGKVLDLIWSIAIDSAPNHPPVISFTKDRDWIAAGKTWRMAAKVSDPDGDSLIFHNNFPPGASYHDSTFEWTPTHSQLGKFQCIFDVYDAGQLQTVAEFYVTVIRYDPTPYLADASPGRTWWIRGYAKTESQGVVDSTFLRRRILVTGRDTAKGNFSYQTIDTLSGTGKDTVMEYLTNASYADGVGYSFFPDSTRPAPPFAGMSPFRLGEDDKLTETASIAIQGRTYSGLRQILANSCLQPETNLRYGCGGHDLLNVPGLGHVSEKTEGMGSEIAVAASTFKTDFQVWAVSEP